MKLKTLIAVCALSLATSTVAHHSVPAYYELGKMVTLTGTVDEFRFVNPHSILKIAVTKPGGKVELWRAESSPVAWLVRNGLRPAMFPKGLKVVITGNAARDEKVKIIRLLTIKMPDGKVYNANTGKAE
jgi:Family of unknown function (DUF6152)